MAAVSSWDATATYPAVIGAATALVMTKAQTPIQSIIVGGALGAVVGLIITSTQTPPPPASAGPHNFPTDFLATNKGDRWPDVDQYTRGTPFTMRQVSNNLALVTVENATMFTSPSAVKELLATRA